MTPQKHPFQRPVRNRISEAKYRAPEKASPRRTDLGARRVPRCRGRSQDAANSARFLAAKSRLRAVRDGMVAEGEELQTNLLQASQRGPASSSVLDEVFGTHNGSAARVPRSELIMRAFPDSPSRDR